MAIVERSSCFLLYSRVLYFLVTILGANWTSFSMAPTKQSTTKSPVRNAPRKQLAVAAAHKTKPVDTEVGREYRYRPGPLELRDIRKLQKTTDLLILRKPFVCSVRGIAQSTRCGVWRFQTKTIEALQVASGEFIM